MGRTGKPRSARRAASIRASGLALAALCAASFISAQGTGSQAALSATDSAGRTLVLPRAAARIVSLSPGATESLLAIGAGDRVVGLGMKIDSLESAIALSPDLLVAEEEGRWARAGIPVFVYAPRDFRELAGAIMALGRLSGRENQGIAVAARLTASARGVALAVDGPATSGRPRVYCSPGGLALATCGADSFLHALIETAGGRDIFADMAGIGREVNGAEIAARAPEAIVLVAGEDGGAEGRAEGRGSSPWPPGAVEVLASTPAGRSGRMLRLDPSLGASAGPRSATALLLVARFLHPEVFP